MIAIDKTSPKPLYEQLEESLRAAILSGRLAPEAAIPEERQLAVDLAISRMTVRRAIMALTEEGLFRRIRGRGTFVTARPAAAPSVAGPTPVLAVSGAISGAVPGVGVSERDNSRPYTVAIVAPFAQTNLASMTFYYRIFQGMQAALAQRAKAAGAAAAGPASQPIALVFRELQAPYGAFVEGLNADGTLDAVVILGIADPMALAGLAALRHP
ncbi:MAG TPA: GntR family transcriptional regulator, partial [Planctomycetota bacterium]|nr:GntR family transcriptional regulator [Planctomycetota bacterium]